MNTDRRNFPDPYEWFRTIDRRNLTLSEYVLLVEIVIDWEPGKEEEVACATVMFGSASTFRKALKGLVDKGYLAVDKHKYNPYDSAYPRERRRERNPRPFWTRSYRFPMMDDWDGT